MYICSAELDELERVRRFERPTLCLASKDSTTELHPHRCLERVGNFEIPTLSLENSCSASELHSHVLLFSATAKTCQTHSTSEFALTNLRSNARWLSMHRWLSDVEQGIMTMCVLLFGVRTMHL